MIAIIDRPGVFSNARPVHRRKINNSEILNRAYVEIIHYQEAKHDDKKAFVSC